MRGWSIVRWYALGAVLWIAAVLLVVRAVDPGFPIVVRGTARASFFLFSASFVAAGLHRLWPVRRTRWLKDNAGYVFLAFAVSHLLHLAAIIAAAVIGRSRPPNEAEEGSQLLGMLSYACILAIAAGYAWRRGNEPSRATGRVLQELGLHYVWLSFASAYLTRSLEHPAFAALGALSILALVVHWATHLPPRT